MSPSRTATIVVLLCLALISPVAVGPVAADDVTLTVTVIDQRSDEVTGVTVTAEWENGSVTGETRANGQALLDVPDGADVDVDVSGSGYIRNSPYEIEDATTREVTVIAAERGEARITVTDEDGPVQGATVELVTGGDTVVERQTGTDGVASTGDVEQHTYDLRVTKSGYLSHSQRLRVEDVTREDVVIEEAIVSLGVTVQDHHFDPSRDVENATVHIEPQGTRLVTLGTGEVSTPVRANRDYDISIAKPGYDNVTTDISVEETDVNVTANISRIPVVNMQVSNERVVVGEPTRITAVDAYSEPIDGAAVELDGETVVETNADGVANVPIDAAGNHTISVSHDGASANVTVEGVGTNGTDGNSSDGDGNQSTDGGIGAGFGAALAVVAVLAGAAAVARRS